MRLFPPQGSGGGGGGGTTLTGYTNSSGDAGDKTLAALTSADMSDLTAPTVAGGAEQVDLTDLNTKLALMKSEVDTNSGRFNALRDELEDLRKFVIQMEEDLD